MKFLQLLITILKMFGVDKLTKLSKKKAAAVGITASVLTGAAFFAESYVAVDKFESKEKGFEVCLTINYAAELVEEVVVE